MKHARSHSSTCHKDRCANQPAATSRLLSLFLAFMAMFALLFARLAHLQLVQGAHYRQLADTNRFFRQSLPAERGSILDRYQQPLVSNTKLYFRHEDEGLFPQKTQVEPSQALELMAEDRWQVSYELRRWYHYPWQLAHTVGYVSQVTAQDLQANKQLKPSSWLGKLGLERTYDQVLQGQDGYQLFEVDTMGRRQRLIGEVPPTAGFDIYTSLDPYLTKVAYEALGEMQGAVVVLDGETGQVLTLVNKPAFNPNELSNSWQDPAFEAQRQASVQHYFQDERRVFFNRAISGTYPPGSTFKLVTAVAGLENQAFDEQRTVLDEGVLKVNEYEYFNWLYRARGATDGEIALVRAIARSNDIYFYKAAEWVGPVKLAEQARQFGFGQVTGIELTGEAAGLVPDPAWKEEVMGERWFLGNTYHFGIGQGDMAATPLQTAQLVQALMNAGELCEPRLVVDDGKTHWSAEHCRNLGLAESSLDPTLRGMIAACQPGGTAAILFKYNQSFASALEESNALKMIEQGALACKTGTSEFGGQDEQGRRRTHGWLVAATKINQSDLTANLEERLARFQMQGWIEDEILTKEEVGLWLDNLADYSFPRSIVLAALVESDDETPFKEGSREAAPIIDAILSYVK